MESPQKAPVNPDYLAHVATQVGKLSVAQKYYLGGALLTLVSSCLPWIETKTSSFMTGSASSSANLWSLGSFNVLLVVYFAPIIYLIYQAYQEITKRRHISISSRCNVLVLIAMLPAAINLLAVIGFWLASSALGSLPIVGQMMSGAFSPGIGVWGGLIGCGLIIYGLLLEIRRAESTLATHTKSA